MSLNNDEWAPITDADLFADPVLESPQPRLTQRRLPVVEPEPEPEAIRPRREQSDPKTWPPRPKPVYTAKDWWVFNYWVHQHDHSIDEAAACAGINVYDALVTLEKRDPWFYEYKIMDGPYRRGSSSEVRRRRGNHMNMGGQGKNYVREEPERTPSGANAPAGRPTPEEARENFLALLAGRDRNERADGEAETVAQFKRGVHVPGKRKKKKRKLKLQSRKCGHCRKLGHNRQTCPDLGESAFEPAGSNSDESDG